MRNYCIPRRTRSQALMRYPKKPFSNNSIEKAYLLGLRAGDISATQHRKQVQVIVGTTHPAQIKMFERVFMGYGHVGKYLYRQDNRCKWYIHCLLDKSFSFLIKKPRTIPDQIIKDFNACMAFLAGYTAAEGNWNICKQGTYLGLVFRLRSYDYVILAQIREKLIEIGFHPQLKLEISKGTERGYSKLVQDFWVFSIARRAEVIRLAQCLLPLSKHEEKIRKMRLALKLSAEKYWKNCKGRVVALRHAIKREVENSAKAANLKL